MAKNAPGVASWRAPKSRLDQDGESDSDTELIGPNTFGGDISGTETSEGEGDHEKNQDLSTLSILSLNSVGTMSIMSDRGSRIEEPSVGFAAGSGHGDESKTREQRIADFRKRERLRGASPLCVKLASKIPYISLCLNSGATRSWCVQEC